MLSSLTEHPPAIVAHRGASTHELENTLKAFRLAHRQGADGVELDVRRTADGDIAVHHDASIPQLGPIIDHNADDVFGVAPWVPRFEDALAACEGMWVNVEVKNSEGQPDWDPEEHLAGAVVGRLARAEWSHRALVSSFNPHAIDRIRRDAPALATGLLIGTGYDPYEALAWAAAAGHNAIHPPFESSEDWDKLVSDAHAQDLWVVVWTVDDPDDCRRLAAAGVDAIITNDPAGVATALGR